MKTWKILGVCAMVSCLCAGRGYCQVDQKAYEKLQKDYANVVADRDNILRQSKNNLEMGQRLADIEGKYKKLVDDNERLRKEIQKANDEIALLQQTAAEQKAAAEASGKESESKVNQLVQENNNLKNSLEKAEIEYKIVPETKRQVARAEAEKKDIARRNAQLEARVKNLEAERLDKEAQAAVYRKQIIDFKKRYEQAMVKNRQFEKKAERLPVKFAEMARENKILIKETALMHYNLGVFYTKNKEYGRAVAEFEKSIELNPEDPYGHFNLGYIYAEYLVDRPKAIANFRKFLSLLKTDDKDADWVKKYILTWQTWEAKKPVD